MDFIGSAVRHGERYITVPVHGRRTLGKLT